jgi:DNA recombination protein RmuC
MNAILIPALVLFAVTVGALLSWFLTKGQAAAKIQAAISEATSGRVSELSELKERVRSAEERRLQDQINFDSKTQQTDALRGELDKARDEIAKLTERALRIPSLEGENVSMSQQMARGAEELRQLSSELSQKTQISKSLGEQVNALQTENSSLAHRLAVASDGLSNLAERKAVLEEQANRLPGVEQALMEAAHRIEQLSKSLGEVREQNGAEVASHRAEREAHQLTRSELAMERIARDTSAADLQKVSQQLNDLRESSGIETSRLTAELASEREVRNSLSTELMSVKVSSDTATADANRLATELAELRSRADAERIAAAEKLALLLEAKETLSDQFKSLANDILEEKSKRFSEQNEATLGHLLNPLKTQLSDFKGKVEEVYVQEGKDRSALAEQVRHLVNLNQALSQDAQNLTRALKGDVKMQGNWGELVLERVLEASGLRKGFEYDVQESQTREDGSRAQADVVIRLPEERSLVVDSKVSLVAYESYVIAQADDDRSQGVRRHLESIRAHIKGLSSKQYQTLYGLRQLDFVLLFVPIEPAFVLAVTNDNELFMDAWNKNVLLVSPSTLLFVVRTVSHLWRQEAQSCNAQEIAKRGAALYDRLCDFVKDLSSVGDKLRAAQESFDSAQKRLSTNNGNVIRQAQMLRDLGVKPTKSLPQSLVDQATDEDSVITVSSLTVVHLESAGIPPGSASASADA